MRTLQFISRPFLPKSLRSFFVMKFVLLGHWRVKRYRCNCCFNCFHSFLWEKGMWSEDERFDNNARRDRSGPQLFKRRIALNSGWISVLSIGQLVFLTLIHYCIGIFLADGTIPFLNNWGQMKMAFMINSKNDDVMMMTVFFFLFYSILFVLFFIFLFF